MQIGFHLTPFWSPADRGATRIIDEAVRVVAAASRMGFAWVSIGQHFVSHPTVWPQPFPILARLAPETGQMRLKTSVLLLPILNPVEVAENVATLDHICHGRLDVGVAIGYREEELETGRRQCVPAKFPRGVCGRSAAVSGDSCPQEHVDSWPFREVLTMDDLQIAWRPLGELIPYARNPRTHSDDQVAQIAASIREFGWTNPVLVDGANGIIAGHGRVLAARKLGLERVPVIELAHLSEAQKRAYVLADNQLALNAGWDEELLRLELADLSELGFDLGLIGFGAGELERLLAGDGRTGLTEDDDAPALPEQAVTEPGDLWLLGEHRLLCGDATVRGDVERVLGGQLADMTFTDPPYGVNYANSPKDKLRGKHRPILNDDLGAGFEAFLCAACANILAVTKGAVYVCMSSSELHTLQRAFTAAGGKWSTFVIWAKHTFTLGRADYQRQYEPILYGWPQGHNRYWCGTRDQGDVWFVDKPARNDLHPTMKPVALVERAIRNSSKTRDIVLDPFGGSGSTLIACEKTGRQARLVELDPQYCDVIVQRWQEWTGEPARLESCGHSFEEVAAGRAAAAA